MYEQFGGLIDKTTKQVTFKLFLPDGERAPFQYEGGGLPRIKDVFVVGSFQNPATRQWDTTSPIRMTSSDYIDPKDKLLKGVVYSHTTGVLPDGFYEYKYWVHFNNGENRFITDPCSRYGGIENQNSGFVVGGQDVVVNPIATRLAYKDLIVYELMIDDFTNQLNHPNESPLQKVVHKLDELVNLGINAIEFMPWIAWIYPNDPTHDFSWGYNPIQYFSIAHKYTLNPSSETDKLVYLKQLVNECHQRNIQVIMDGVFNHADVAPPNRGFPYYWLYEDPADSPYVGNFAQAAFFQDLDYANRCTLEYIRDACIYWIDTFKIDGIRFDNTVGMYKADDRGHGLPKLLSELRAHLAKTNYKNFALILEHEWNYSSVDVTNKVGATSCWLDPYRSLSMDFLGNRPNGIPQIEPSIMRMLNSGRDFNDSRVPTIYIENHDHLRFMLKAGGRNFWYLTQPYVIALFTCAGAPLIYNGQEFGLDNDMPESGNRRVIPRPIDWSLRGINPGPTIFDLYKKMINIRKNHPGLRSLDFYPPEWKDDEKELNPQGFGIDHNRNIVVYHRWGNDELGRLERFYVALNFSQQTQHISFEVPNVGPWEDLISGTTLNAVNNRLQVNIASNWGAIYYKKF